MNTVVWLQLTGSFTSVYEDVAKTLHFWRMRKFIKLYTLASGKSAGQQLFLANTLAGDLNPLIANCMDPSSFGKEDKKCFIAISLALRSDPDKLIYLTDNVKRMYSVKLFWLENLPDAGLNQNLKCSRSQS